MNSLSRPTGERALHAFPRTQTQCGLMTVLDWTVRFRLSLIASNIRRMACTDTSSPNLPENLARDVNGELYWLLARALEQGRIGTCCESQCDT